MRLRGFTIFLTQLSMLAISVPASAGPSFNSDRSGLAKLSEQAGSELHSGFARFHEMLRCLELHQLDCAKDSKARTLAAFDEAVTIFEKVAANAPRQKLIMEPSNDEEKSALSNFRERLKAEKIPFPESEQELANIAVELVRRHTALLKEANFQGTKADYPSLRRVLSSQGAVLDIGILASIAWTISTSKQ